MSEKSLLRELTQQELNGEKQPDLLSFHSQNEESS
jgi:hypothetical protein